MRPSWIAKRNGLSNSESLCHSNVSRQVSAQSSFRFGSRCPLKNFKMAAMMAILDIGTEQFLQLAPMPLIKFRLNLTYGLGDVV